MHLDLLHLFLTIGLILFLARCATELFRCWKLPSIAAEILLGIFLGPTVLGALSPSFEHLLFPQNAANSYLLDGLAQMGVVLFLFVAGLEIDLSSIRRLGTAAVRLSLVGFMAPFALAFALAWWAPSLIPLEGHVTPLVLCLFFATAISISALPVIAKTLMDLGLYKSNIGQLMMSAAVVQDVMGWLCFAVALSASGGIAGTLAMTLAFLVVTLTVARSALGVALPYLRKHLSWPQSGLAFLVALAFLAAAVTEKIGIHALFGAFLVGVAAGDSKFMQESAQRDSIKNNLENFVGAILLPLFFVNIGLKVNFAANFNLLLVLAVLSIACVGKILPCMWAARSSGLSARESWAVGFGMNSRGAMEIVLATVALEKGLIGERFFVALAIMALVTSLMSAPFILLSLGRQRV